VSFSKSLPSSAQNVAGSAGVDAVAEGYSRVMTGYGDGVLSDARIAAMSPDERRDLIQRLQRPVDEGIRRRSRVACGGIG
jgi:hypothetical protein